MHDDEIKQTEKSPVRVKYDPHPLKQWRQSLRISAFRLSKMLGVHPSFISNVEANRRSMPEEFMRKLSAIPEANISYNTLRAWKLLSEYTPEEIEEAYSLMQ